MKIQINVTAEDIINGEQNNCEFCPITLAVQRIIPNPNNIFVEVYENIMYFEKLSPWSEKIIQLNDECKKFIQDFDNLPLPSNLQPFSFIIELPDDFFTD